MRLDKVIFQVGDKTRNIRCYQVTAEPGEHSFFYDGELHSSLLPIIERQLRMANHRIAEYKRECAGKHYSRESALFWEAMLENGTTTLMPA